jgi:glycosyltransferase involved in cell wall biosynthesis
MNKQTHIMHITYDMRIGGTEMVIKNIIDGLANVGRTSVRPNNEADDPNVGRNSFRQDESDSTVRPELVEGFKMSVLCIESPLGPFAEELQSNGIEFHELNRQPGFDTNLIKKIRQVIKNNNVDIIHCHQYTPWVYGVIAAAFTKTKVIFTEHGRFYPDSSTWKRKLINPILNLFTDQVTVISKATKQALIEFENIPEKSIDVIYNGITPLKVEQNEVAKLKIELTIPNNHNILGTIARFDPIKNHTMMLRAFSLVLKQQPNSTLIIVGDGEERVNIEACINELNISNNVILTGYQTKPQNYLALMDIYLLSSLSEGTSMTLLEAMSLSKPCVVTDAGGNPEIIINTENGFVTPNDNIEKFALGIEQTIESILNKNDLGQASKNRFSTLFSEKSMNTKYQNLYKKLKVN